MSEPIETVCPRCGKFGKAPGTFAGKQVRCRHCHQRFLLVESPGDRRSSESAEPLHEAMAEAIEQALEGLDNAGSSQPDRQVAAEGSGSPTSAAGAVNLGRLFARLSELGGPEVLRAVVKTLGEADRQQLGTSLKTASESEVDRIAEDLMRQAGYGVQRRIRPGLSDTAMYTVFGIMGTLGGAAGLWGGLELVRGSTVFATRPISTVLFSTAAGAVLGAGLLGLPIWLLFDWLFEQEDGR
jgi:hypothetical protein